MFLKYNYRISNCLVRDTRYLIPGGGKLELIFGKDTVNESSSEQVEVAEVEFVNLFYIA